MLGLALGGAASAAAPEPPPVEQSVAEHTRTKPVRKPLPPNLPREEIEVVPPEVERDPDAFQLIGTETREVLAELNLRRQVVGRKNWLFVGSDDGGEINATVVPLLASCGLHKIEPFAYMRDLLCLLPRWPSHRVLELAPAYWRQTLEKREAQQALHANVLRRVVLGLQGAASHRPPELPRQVGAVANG